MNGHSDLLGEADLRASLVALDPKIIRMRFDGFPSDINDLASMVFYTWNGPRVLERVGDFTGTQDWENGLVNFGEARQSIYGDYDGPCNDELMRLTRLHFTENSDYNRSLSSGYTYVGEPSTGIITRQSVYAVAREAQAKKQQMTLDRLATEAQKGRDRNGRGRKQAMLLLMNVDGPEADAMREELEAQDEGFGPMALNAVQKFFGSIGTSSGS